MAKSLTLIISFGSFFFSNCSTILSFISSEIKSLYFYKKFLDKSLKHKCSKKKNKLIILFITIFFPLLLKKLNNL